jgi:hypothetical protein
MICGKFSTLTQFSPSVSVAPWTLPMFSVGELGALGSDGSEFANDDVPAGSVFLSSGVVVGVDGTGLSSSVVVGVDGAGRAGAELYVELRPAKEVECL